MNKYKLNCNYLETTDYAIGMAKDIIEYLNNGDYDNLDTAIMQEIDNELIYYDDQWELMKNYQTPQEANIYMAIEMLIAELHSIITEEDDDDE